MLGSIKSVQVTDPDKTLREKDMAGNGKKPAAAGRKAHGAAAKTAPAKRKRITSAQLRSKLWFDNPENPGMTALYLER